MVYRYLTRKGMVGPDSRNCCVSEENSSFLLPAIELLFAFLWGSTLK